MGVSEQTSTDGIRAAYGLALRMTGSDATAGEVVARAARVAGLEPVPLVRAVRTEARAVTCRPDRVGVPRPHAFQEVDPGDWGVVERIALRGMTVTEAAAATGLSRTDVIARLQRGMRTARACVEGRKAPGDAEPAAAGARGGDRPARRLDDAARHRQAEPAPFSGLPA